MLCVFERPGRFLGNRGYFTVHVEQLALIKAEAFNDVLERVRVDRLFECLAQQILPAFGLVRWR